MQTAANAGAFDILIVHKLDRFSRHVIAGLRVVNEFRAIGVSFVSVMEQFFFTSPMGEMTLTPCKEQPRGLRYPCWGEDGTAVQPEKSSGVVNTPD